MNKKENFLTKQNDFTERLSVTVTLSRRRLLRFNRLWKYLNTFDDDFVFYARVDAAA